MHINDQMEAIGWKFCQIEQNKWTWIKFNSLGQKIAEYGGRDWKADRAMLGATE